MRKSAILYSALFVAAFVLVLAVTARCQVQVALAPNPHPQFLNASGAPLAGGFLYTYAAGTTTPLNTYIDATGTIQNPDPILLDSTGAPSNGSVQTGVWLANNAYKFCAYDSSNVQQWCADNIVGYLGLLNLANTWTFQQTFSLPIIDTQPDNQIVLGSPGTQTTLDAPPPSSNITLHFPNSASQNILGSSSPSMSLPFINNVQVINTPGAYVSIPNSAVTGTFAATLTKLTGAPSSGLIAATTDTNGILGVCVTGCGITGSGVIQQSGAAILAFDGSTTAGDYVIISPTVAGYGHDAGANYPSSGQVIGRVLSTNTGIGDYVVNLYGPDVRAVTAFSTPTVAGGPGAGTSPTVTLSANSTDAAGQVQVITGASPSFPNPIFTVTFGHAHTAAFCTWSPFDSPTAALGTAIYGGGEPTNLQLVAGASVTGPGSHYNWQYTCSFVN